MTVEHEHTGLHHGHPHLVGATQVAAGWWHSHGVFADELHPTTATRAASHSVGS